MKKAALTLLILFLILSGVLLIRTAAMLEGTGLGEVQKVYPGRVFDVGIAEEHAVIMAAGIYSTIIRFTRGLGAPIGEDLLGQPLVLAQIEPTVA